jgi:SulP family sulfate permease
VTGVYSGFGAFGKLALPAHSKARVCRLGRPAPGPQRGKEALIPHRKSSLVPAAYAPRRFNIPVAVALRRTFQQGYSWRLLGKDALAGVVVGIVALPLSMALAVAVGVAPQQGLYTAIIAGVVVALTGGSKHQVTGPTAAFIVILAPITSKYGFAGLLTAGLMAGVLLVLMGAMRLGRLIEFIPHPVTTGFTAGIATVIATLQIKDVLGLPIAKLPDGYFEKLAALWEARRGASVAELAVAAATLALLLAWPRVSKALPSPLVAIVVVSVGAMLVARAYPGFHVATIGSRFHSTVGGRDYAGIPPVPPTPMLPWAVGGMTLARFRELMAPALAIAMLGAIESLLSAVIADAMTGKKHDPNAELVGLGLGNLVAPFFGGIAATGALARTATNIRAGATSPIAAVVHSLTVLAAVLVAAPLVAYVPMAALAALLLLVAWNMSELRHFAHTVRVAPRSDVTVLLTCYALTVAFDMVVAIATGVVLAALLFMKRMSELTSSRIFSPPPPEDQARVVPEGVIVYEIAGPLFFGAAQKAMGAIGTVGVGARAVVLALGTVPTIDATGLVALESAIDRLRHMKKLVVIAGPLPEPKSVFEKANLEVAHEHVFFADTLDQGIQLARDLVLLAPESVRPPRVSTRPA